MHLKRLVEYSLQGSSIAAMDFSPPPSRWPFVLALSPGTLVFLVVLPGLSTAIYLQEPCMYTCSWGFVFLSSFCLCGSIEICLWWKYLGCLPKELSQDASAGLPLLVGCSCNSSQCHGSPASSWSPHK